MKKKLINPAVAFAVFFFSLGSMNTVEAQMGMHLLDKAQHNLNSLSLEDPFGYYNLQDEGKRSQAFFVELGGPGLIITFNYDTRFSSNPDGLGIRAGIGGFVVGGDGFFAIPVQLNYLLGTAPHYFEIGLGASFFSGKFDVFNDNETFTTVYGTMAFGYRLQPLDKGFLFRAGLTPIFGSGGGEFFFIPYFPGISFGYAF